jgi:nitrogenase molybdenum-iron protein beta chain
VPVIHSAMGCGGALGMSSSFSAGYLGAGYCSGYSAPSSASTEKEIIFGGAERLQDQIKSTLELINAQLYVVATSCMTEMIGDDVFGVVSEFSGSNKPVIAINTPSFKGNSYAGYEILLEGIFNQYLPRVQEKEEGLVNIFGLVPAYDPFFRGDLTELARLLSRLGLRVNTFFTPDQSFRNLESAPGAALNILLSPVYGTEFVKHFEEKHGVPCWVTDLPIGAEATDRFLLALGERLDIPEVLVQALIQEENEEYYGYFARAADLFADGDMKYYSVTATNSNYLIPVTSFLQKELGWVGVESFVTDQLKDNQREELEAAYRKADLEAELVFETDTSRIAKNMAQRFPENRGQRYFDDYSPLYIVGSSLEKAIATKRGVPQLSISYPVYNRLILDRGYAGYRGGLHLFEDLIDVIVSPR